MKWRRRNAGPARRKRRLQVEGLEDKVETSELAGGGCHRDGAGAVHDGGRSLAGVEVDGGLVHVGEGEEVVGAI